MKKIALMTAAMLACAAACSSGETGGAGQGGRSPGTVEITMWHGQEDTSADSVEKLVAEFNRTHPTIKVTTDSGGVTADAMLPKVTTALAADTYPDIAYMYGSWSANIARSPKAVDLTSYVKDPKVGWDDFWPNTRATVTVRDKVIGFPAVVDDLAVLYNRKLLAKAGLKEPSKDWTWDDFRAMARSMTDPATKTYGTTWAVSGGEETTWGLWPLLWQNGGQILAPGDKKAAFNSPAGVQALTVLQQMAVVDKSVYVDSSPAEKGQKLFESGRLGLMLAGPWVLPDLQKAKVDFGIAVLPGTGGDHQTISGPDNWVVLDRGEDRVKASVEFLAWLTAPEQQMVWMKDTGSLPTRKSITALPGYKDFVAKYPGIQVVTDNLVNAKQVRPASTKYPRVSAYVAEAIAAVLIGRKDPKSALDEAAVKSDAVLAVPGQ
ncbi:ABC transporter substrate-binding protein [Streptosporangium sp. NPDC000396]|uniref:ABC transporter substrate-binding protein n=1 Tax=Streptosporangium sp. NPDC000396 TaxID=3366185 RepID=UPI0036C0047D